VARRRMIDPNFWMSEDVGKLSIFERLMLIGMFSNADDEGKGRANLPLLRSMIFPYDDVQISEMETAISNVRKFIHLDLYEVDGNKYYKFERWKKWQRVDKPSKSIIPDVGENNSKNDSESDSKNDSGAKEKKRREDNIKENKTNKEGISSNSNFNIFSFMQQCGFVSISPIMAEKINADIELYSLEEVKSAIEIADGNGVHTYKYVKGILEKRRAGINEKMDSKKQFEQACKEFLEDDTL
jgi:DNA replication protein DnaD